MEKKVTAAVERMVIPTYCPPAPEEMPMYSEFRQHQGSTGYAYPNKVTVGVERQTLTDREYTVVRLENDYVRLLILPELGGRILEGYDKTTNYNFLYRHHRIKPVIVGSYGSWISGGMEFNYPFHHRPSTFMPADFTLESMADGSQVCWISEAAPSPGQYRMKGTVGIRLRPNASYLETMVKLDNRTPVKHPFMWWENAGIHVNNDYQLFFPQDVNWVHHHNDRHHATFPITKGWYAVENHKDETDISLHKNTVKGNSYFAGPSRYDFFGGYDHSRDCGTLHVADHHITPGKKMFQWALEDLGDAWNGNLTDMDGEHAELMAGSFSNDQPDFSYIQPYEVKYFSQYWYPIHGVKLPVFANLNGAVALDRELQKIRITVPVETEGALFEVLLKGQIICSDTITLKPSEYKEYDAKLDKNAAYTVRLVSKDGVVLMDYTEDRAQEIRLPKDNIDINETRSGKLPHQLKTAQEVYLMGNHVEQYRDPSWKGREYYKVALDKDPDYVPALVAMAEDCYNTAHYEDGLKYIARAEKVLCRWNQNPEDGSIYYFKGLLLWGLHREYDAYETLFKATWSNNVVSPAMTLIAAIDGRRRDWGKMKEHAACALRKEKDHSICQTYCAIADYKLGNTKGAITRLRVIVAKDPLDHLARFVLSYYAGAEGVAGEGELMSDFYGKLFSNPSQTCLDIALNLMDAGLIGEAISVLEGLENAEVWPDWTMPMSTMAHYTLAVLYGKAGDEKQASKHRTLATANPYVDTFPFRLEEIDILKAIVKANPEDATAQYLLGNILYDKLFYAEAAECWKKASMLSPDFYIPYRNLAVASYSKLGRKDEAVGLLKKAVEVYERINIDPDADAAKTRKQEEGLDVLVKELNYVMCKQGVDGRERLSYVLEHKPCHLSDNLTWDIADAYSNVFEFDKALDMLSNHEFVAAECQETYLTEAYTFALCCKGRLLRREGKLQEALDCFRRSRQIPANFRAGWWDTQALYYAVYFEAETLKMMGREEEAKSVAQKNVPFIHSGYSPYMGPECDYYVALSMRMLGDNVNSREYMSRCIMQWEEEVSNDADRKPIVTSLYWSYVPDAVKESKAAYTVALAYGKMFFGDREGAAKLFREALGLNPDNLKAKFELYLMEN
jgi:tetratricopeptide (TPR) repeat protein